MKNWALIVLYTGAVTPPNIKEKSKICEGVDPGPGNWLTFH
jgi:hypothetical protein